MSLGRESGVRGTRWWVLSLRQQVGFLEIPSDSRWWSLTPALCGLGLRSEVLLMLALRNEAVFARAPSGAPYVGLLSSSTVSTTYNFFMVPMYYSATSSFST